MSALAVEALALGHCFGEGAGERRVLRSASFAVRTGEVVAFTGPSGSGKSSLFALIGGLRPVQQGELTVLGVPLHAVAARDIGRLRGRVRFIFQHFHLLDSLNVLENVAIGLVDAEFEQAAARAERMLHEVGLHEHRHKRRAQLSGGEQQRVAIARALVANPELLLADEPTAALDAANGIEVIKLIRNLVHEKRCTALVASHDDRILPYVDRVLHIEDGRIVTAGNA